MGFDQNAMKWHQVTSLVATVSLGAVLLTACGSTEELSVAEQDTVIAETETKAQEGALANPLFMGRVIYLRGEMNGLVSAVSEAGGDMSRVNGDSIFPVLNLLNAKYFIFPGQDGQSFALQNPYVNGPAWFVSQMNYTTTADEEMATLKRIDLKHATVADQQFKAVLGEAAPTDSGSIKLVSYAPNELHYDVESAHGGVVVFSEIYYPGWSATIDGKPVEIGRADYILRALRVPAGRHSIVMEFRPTSITTTEVIAYTAIALILIGFVAALVLVWRRSKGATQPAVKD